jgi:DNA-binding transcriptional LysR family regulator
MDTQTLETFIALADTKSFTKTANRLFVAQSTVTNRINELEKEVKLRLFSRSNKSVSLTNEGEKFRVYAQKVLDLTENALAELSQEHRFSGHIRIGSADSIYEGHLAPQIRAYKDKHPETSLKISIGLSNHLLEQLHILANLVVIFGLGTAELKVDDMRLAPVSHHTVGTTLEDGSVGIQTENGALVEQRPIVREPITYTSVFKSFV